MTITKFIQTRNLRALINYVKTSDNENDRVAFFSTLNTSFSNAEREMMNYIHHLGKENNVQGFHVIQSFDINELNPNNDSDIELANKAGHELAKRLYPNNQVLIVTQIDGKSGLVHNHIVGNQSNLIDGKSLKDNQKNHYHIAKTSDKVLKDLKIENVLSNKKAYYRDDKSKNEQYLKAKKQSLYKDDIRTAIEYSLAFNPTSFEALQNDLKSWNIEITLNNRKDDYQYHILDSNGKKRHAMGKRLNKNGRYSKKSIDQQLKENRDEERREQIEERRNQIFNVFENGFEKVKYRMSSFMKRFEDEEDELIESVVEKPVEPIVEPVVEKPVKKRIPNRKPKPVEPVVEKPKRVVYQAKQEPKKSLTDDELLRKMEMIRAKHGGKSSKSNEFELWK